MNTLTIQMPDSVKLVDKGFIGAGVVGGTIQSINAITVKTGPQMKATDDQILQAIAKLTIERNKRWYHMFNASYQGFRGFRRQAVQDKVKELFGIEYTDSGFRGRLKSMVKKGVLKKETIMEGQPRYIVIKAGEENR